MLGENLRKKRIEMKLSQRELAEMLGCERKLIMGIENGVKRASENMICALARLFECTTDELLFGEGGKK